MTQPQTDFTQNQNKWSGDLNAIRPFRVEIPEEQVVDLQRRLKATRWPDKETVPDNSQGVKLELLQDMAKYWATDYDWRRCEARMNEFPQFITNIDGLDIHFIHVRSKHANALPLIITHGWPGSVIEQMKIIDPLVNPTEHNGIAADAFHVVIPSMPGYGFSGKPTDTGWGPDRIAKMWAMLMERLGYKEYVAQGGDWGAVVTDLMGVQAPKGLLGIHSSLPRVVPADLSINILSGAPTPPELAGEEKATVEKLKKFFAREAFYALEMATRPQTLCGIADSPIGLASWMIDHGDGDDQPAATIIAALKKPTGKDMNVLTRDDVIDNISLYWFTNTGVSSGRLYWENKFSLIEATGISVPAAVTVYPGELFQAPKSWAEKAYKNLIYYNKAEKGGHFAAWEEPETFTSELRKAFKSLRRGSETKASMLQ